MHEHQHETYMIKLIAAAS